MKNLILTVLLFFQTGCGIFGPGERLEPGQLCSDHSDDAIPTFEDAALAEAALDAVNRSGTTPFFGSRDVHDELTCSLISRPTELDASSAGITSLVGIQNLTNLMSLDLRENSITDISSLSGLVPHPLRQEDAPPHPGLRSLNLNSNSITDISSLSGLTGLGVLVLSSNSITDISALSGLTSLGFLSLDSNSISDIQPLLDNPGLGPIDPIIGPDVVNLRATNVSCADVTALEAKGVTVTSDCP